MFVFSADTLEHLFTVPFKTSGGEGWGLTHDGQHFIASDGTDKLTYLTVPANAEDEAHIIKIVQVHYAHNGKGIERINELQYVDGVVWANVWYKDVLLRVNASSGAVTGEINMSSLWPKRSRTTKADCLNGIAYDADSNRFLLTGKLWDKYYWINVLDKPKKTFPSNKELL